VDIEAVEDDASQVERNAGDHAVGGGACCGQPVPFDAERGRAAEHEVPLRGEASERERCGVEKEAEGTWPAVVEGVDVVGLLVAAAFAGDGGWGGSEKDARAGDPAGETEQPRGERRLHAPPSDARAKGCVSRYPGRGRTRARR